MQKGSSFTEITIPEFLDIVLSGDEQSDEAMYFLLHQRLVGLLGSRFAPFQHRIHDSFDDVLTDFFLYLRGDGRHPETYHSLRTIRNKDSFEVWLLNTFRNYLNVRVDKEGRMEAPLSFPPEGGMDMEGPRLPSLSGEGSGAGLEESQLTDERKLILAANLIAYAHQTFSPCDRFLLLRSLLTLLNRGQALPNDEMAQALGMSAIAYRVSVHRMRKRLSKIRTALLGGEEPHLDDSHSQMAHTIEDNFERLYPTLFAYYLGSIENLPDAAAVKQLRQRHIDATSRVLHEQEYMPVSSVGTFWTMLSSLAKPDTIVQKFVNVLIR